MNGSMPRCRSRAPIGSKANDSLRLRKTFHLIDGRCHRHRFIGRPAREAMMRPFRLFETSSQISYRHPTATNYPRCPRSDFDAVPRVVHSIPNSPRGLIAGWSPAIHMITDVYVESSVARIPATGALSSLNSVPNRHSIHYNSLITPGEFISPWESHYGTRLLCGCGSASVSSSCQLMLLSRIYPPHGLGEGTGIYTILYATISCSSLLQWRIRAWEQEGRA